jgi:2-deoxy-D-gluconate 3-dehydrogenase
MEINKFMTVKEMFNLEGKTALVTGGRKGIGLAIAKALSDHGADIISVSSQQSESDDELSTYVRSLGKNFSGIRCDFTKRQEVSLLCDSLKDTRIDILVNNAGFSRRNLVLAHTEENWDETMEIDLRAPFFLSQEIAKGMVQRGYGKIIFIASMWSFQGGLNVISYTAAKTGIIGLTRGMSNELVGRGVHVNAIAPGFIATDITAPTRNDPQRMASISGRIPIGHWGQPEDLAGAAVFLASKASDYVSGIVLPVDGGYLAN